jgi:tetratricopeptide (TPR) repeat protein
MSNTYALDEVPTRATFAALAEGLRKRGDHAEAATVVLRWLAEHPADVPGLLVLARIRQDQGDSKAVEGALQAAFSADPTHPVVRRALGVPLASLPRQGHVQVAEEAEELIYSDDDAPPSSADPLLTESLAVLYHRQGHLERAREVYSALLERDPENAELRLRRDQLVAATESRRPRPYDAAVSGGRPLGEWLGTLATMVPTAKPASTGYDAFFHAAAVPPPPDEMADFAAFQSWLKGLER